MLKSEVIELFVKLYSSIFSSFSRNNNLDNVSHDTLYNEKFQLIIIMISTPHITNLIKKRISSENRIVDGFEDFHRNFLGCNGIRRWNEPLNKPHCNKPHFNQPLHF